MILIWLPRAIKNRDSLIDYIANENPVAAIDQDEKIEVQTDQLISYPELGKPGSKQGTRELVISRTSFVVVYRIKPKAKRVEIMRVLHTSQQRP
jgi:toxin ParE1/3/4